MRLIDADDCEKYFYEHLDDLHMYGAMNAISEMPTVRAVPVVHAEWEKDGEHSYGESIGKYLCSNCDFEIYSNLEAPPTFRYCPGCGAKMDGGDDE